MNLRNLPRYAKACMVGLLRGAPRSYLKLLGGSPYTVQYLPVYDVSMIVDVRDPAISKPILALGEYEPGLTKVLMSLVSESTNFVDVGANIGFYTLIAGSRAARGRVWSIEPDPTNARLLRANVALNGLEERVTVCRAAASDADGEVYFSSLGHDANIGARFTAKEEQRLLALMRPGAPSPVKVAAVRIDDVTRGAAIDLVKIDVEGHEPAVFGGMQRLLEQDRPIILSEFAPGTLRHISGVDPGGFLEDIAGRGYAFGVIGRDGRVDAVGARVDDVAARCAAGGEHHMDLLMTPEETFAATLERVRASVIPGA